jgi:transcriptional regulator with XRE-family HTH domain
MSQNKIGEFIQQSRKAKGLTQKDLGDQIGVSDKTISKWENGNSVPDTSILNELCASLNINVNELLSGEKLTPEIYSMKAEENMMNLLEDNQKQQRSTILPFAAGVILLLLTGLLAIFTHVFSPDMLELWDVPTLLIYIGICCSLVLLSGKRHKQEIIHFLRKIVVPVGCICPLLGINQFIHQFRDPSDIGSFVNQCVLFVLYSLILSAFVYRTVGWKELWKSIIDSAIDSGTVMLIVGGCYLFGWVISNERWAVSVTNMLVGLHTSLAVKLLLVNLVLLVVGMFMDSAPAIMLVAPILAPAMASLGVDPIQTGMIVCLNLTIGLATPPVGVCLYTATNIARCKFGDTVRNAIPFLVAMLAALAIITNVPVVSRIPFILMGR